MALVRFNALAGTWERQVSHTLPFQPISRAAAQALLFKGHKQAPMWTGPKPPDAAQPISP